MRNSFMSFAFLACAFGASSCALMTMQGATEVGGLEESDAIVEKCETKFEEVARDYSTTPIDLSDIKIIAVRVVRSHSILSKLLTLNDRSNGAQDFPTFVANRNKILYEIRTKAVHVLADEECGSAADEYLAEILFKAPQPDPSHELSRLYVDIDDPGLSYRQFLLLLLVMSLNQEISLH